MGKHLGLYGAVVLNGRSEGRVAARVGSVRAHAGASGALGDGGLQACKGPVHAHAVGGLRLSGANGAAAVEDGVAACAHVPQDVLHRARRHTFTVCVLAQTPPLVGTAGAFVTGRKRRLVYIGPTDCHQPLGEEEQ